jgi:hypothetical protein
MSCAVVMYMSCAVMYMSRAVVMYMSCAVVVHMARAVYILKILYFYSIYDDWPMWGFICHT